MGENGISRGNTSAMRVLIADQESETLEAIARAFEVDVATSKGTCIDLLRANEYDVLIACERLTDGSGLELLSQVGKRWPNVLRVLAIEPARRAMLKGKLSPFKLFETLAYPIDADKLETLLERAQHATGSSDDAGFESPPEPARRAKPAGKPVPSRAAPTTSRPSAPAPAPRAAPRPPPRRRPDRYVPLGAPTGKEFRIVPQDYTHAESTVLRRLNRNQKPAPKTLVARVAALAADLGAAIRRFLKR